jgi:hypothetical protein
MKQVGQSEAELIKIFIENTEQLPLHEQLEIAKDILLKRPKDSITFKMALTIIGDVAEKVKQGWPRELYEQLIAAKNTILLNDKNTRSFEEAIATIGLVAQAIKPSGLAN